MILADLILAEFVYDLETVSGAPRARIAEAARSVLALPSILVADHDLLLRAIELYEIHRLDFADAYLCAAAESLGIEAVASFDRGIDRVKSVRRLAP